MIYELVPSSSFSSFTHDCCSRPQAKSNSSHSSDRLDYEQYLSCLVRVAQKCYPHAGSAEDAMQQLLMDNILPLGKEQNDRC